MSKLSPRETGTEFTPRFDSNGLIVAVAQDVDTDEVLMLAYMNAEALEQTIRTGLATFYSRSRRQLWVKGQTSGHVLHVREIRVDCDQDCLLLRVKPAGGVCHVGYHSCFYRRLVPGQAQRLEFIAEKTYNPDEVYK